MGNENLFQIRRSKNIFFTLAISIAFSSSFASGFASSLPGDSSLLPVKEHKINRAQFLEKYGRDDSTRAFINFYFTVKQKSTKMIWFTAVSIIVLSIIYGIIAASYSQQQYAGNGFDDVGTTALIVFFGGAFYTLYIFLIIGIVRTLMYSRKKLLRILKNYYDGHSLPRRIARSKAFIMLLQAERKMSHPRVSPGFYLHE